MDLFSQTGDFKLFYSLNNHYMSTSRVKTSFLFLILLGSMFIQSCATGSSDDNNKVDCSDGEVLCGDSCVDLNTNTSHCGSCNLGCETSEICVTGACQCKEGEFPCGDVCVDLNANSLHCGSCDNQCENGESCLVGECAASCENECPEVGDSECVDKSVRTCGEYDNVDSCLEWSDPAPCDTGFMCNTDGTECVNDCGDFCDDFSIILLPDTQYYTDHMVDDDNNIYYKQTQWIVDTKDQYNTKFVIHLGDITNRNLDFEWDIASKAHQTLDDADVPYSIMPGNHDYSPINPLSRGGTKLNQYFGVDRFQSKPWYGGSFQGRSENNYTLFNGGDSQFMVLSLEHAPRKDALCWANNVISEHPDHRVIIVTHCYLTHGANYASCANGYDVIGGSGATVWDELVSRHSNIFMVLSGHVGDSEYRADIGINGNIVHQILTDYQFEVPCSAGSFDLCDNHCGTSESTGNGWLRRLVFSPSNDTIGIETYTVVTGEQSIFPGGVDKFFCSSVNVNGHDEYDESPAMADHHYTIAYDMTAATSEYQYQTNNSERFSDQTVNSAGSGNQVNPTVAMNKTGDFVVSWDDDTSSSDGAGNFDIYARGFKRGGCECVEDIFVNSTISAEQQNQQSVAIDANGNFVVVWRDDNDGNDLGQIYARGFNADGTEKFGIITVNSTAAGDQKNPSVAINETGDFVVVWEDNSDDTDGAGNYDIYARGFNLDGSERFGDLLVNTVNSGQQRFPAITINSSGVFVVVWEDDADGNGGYQIKARGFGLSGSETFAPMTVNSVPDGQQLKPDVAIDSSGNFAVVWEDDQDNNGTFQVLARGFTSTGTETFSDMTVNSVSTGQQLVPAIAMTSTGDFVVVWEDNSQSSYGTQIFARGFTSTGVERFSDVTINSDKDGEHKNPDVAIDENGGFVVAWQDDVDNNGYWEIVTKGMFQNAQNP
jgi:Calcineurin-like phosphoesterase/Stigma-specific protein, Stig1